MRDRSNHFAAIVLARLTFAQICDRAGMASFSRSFINCRSSAALNAWFGHSQAVAERHYEKVTEDDYAEVANPMPSDVGQTVGQSGGTLEVSVRITAAEKPKKPLLVLSEGSTRCMEYRLFASNLMASDSLTVMESLRDFAVIEAPALLRNECWFFLLHSKLSKSAQ